MVDDATIFSVLQHQHEERAGDTLDLAAGLVVALRSRTHNSGSIVFSLDDLALVARKYHVTRIIADNQLVITFEPRETADDAKT